MEIHTTTRITGEAMSDPLHELAEANVELGNRPPPQPVVRRTMTAAEYAAQQLAASVPAMPQPARTLVVQQTYHAPSPPRESSFAKGFWVTMGVLAALFVFSFIIAFMNGCFAAMMNAR
jgi:hypothetical protein